jgi:hypothetical protein
MASIGIQNKIFISAISLLDEREILKNVLDIHNDAELTSIFAGSNRYKVSKQATYHNYVNEALYKLIDTTGATVGTSGTPEVTTTATAATSGFARLGELVKFPDGKVGIITAITRTTTDALTITSVDGTNITHTAGQKLAVFSNAVGAKSTAPSNRRYGRTKYLNKIQFFREVNEIDDVQSVSTVETRYQGKDVIVFKDLMEKALKHKADVNAAFIGGYLSADSFDTTSATVPDPVGGGNLQTTRGLDQYVTTYGVVDAVDTAGVIDIDDFEDLFTQLITAKAPKSYTGYVPSKAMGKIDKCLKALNSSGASSGHLNLDGKSIDFDVTNFSFMNFKIQFTGMGILDHQELFTQTNIVKSMYLVPNDGVKVEGGGTEPRIQARYFKAQVRQGQTDNNEVWEEWNDGALAPTGPIGSERIWRTNWFTSQGLECLGVQHFAKCVIL